MRVVFIALCDKIAPFFLPRCQWMTLMKDFLIAPSILSADFARLGDVAKVLAAGADVVHFDVMDNHYVPNLTIGPMVCQALRDYGIEAPIDVHLMVKPVDRIVRFCQGRCQPDHLPPGSVRSRGPLLGLIKEQGCQAGLVLNPATRSPAWST
jgi:ribulose-phosphate 3-epimerase